MDKIAFGNLIMENEVQLYRIAKSILRNDEDCMDAAQEAVTRAFERLDTLRNDSYAKTWLIRILIHECYRLAKEKRKTVSMEAWPDEVMQKQDYTSHPFPFNKGRRRYSRICCNACGFLSIVKN